MEERKLNEKESLELITQMIKNTQNNTQVGNANQFIVSGVATLITAIVVGTLISITNNQDYQFFWFLIPIIIITWSHFAKKKETITTHIDKMLRALWFVIVAFCISIPLLITAIAMYTPILELLYFQDGRLFLFIPFVEILFVSIGIAVTGIIIDYKAFKVAGFVGMVISFFTLFALPWIVPYAFAIFAIACLIIPGIKFNRQLKRSKLC